jgi:phosphomannomutase
VAGFEANGCFLLGSSVPAYPTLAPLPTRDAVLPVVCLLAQAKRQNQPLSALVAVLPQRYTASDRLQNFVTEKSKALIESWSSSARTILQALNLDETVRDVDTTDGLRVTCISGHIIHLRPSGNAPELRCYVESDSATLSQALVNKVLKQLAYL